MARDVCDQRMNLGILTVSVAGPMRDKRHAAAPRVGLNVRPYGCAEAS